MNPVCNIAAALPQLAAQRPDQVAIRCPGRGARYDVVLDYAQLDARSDAIAAGLARRGVARGTRTVVMVRPTPEFFLLMFALFKAGAVPVLVDPGIDKRALRQCLGEAQAEAFIGIPLSMLARRLLGWATSARVRVTTGARAWLADATLAQVERDGAGAGPQLCDTHPDDVAAILFTSGSTGVPKGVVYRHRHFTAQVDMLRTAFGMQAGGIDLPTFPPFALFDPALGLTSIIPDMDPTRPAAADPAKLLSAIERFGVTQLFGSPALMRVLAEHGAALPTVRCVTSAGAPVPADVVAKMQALLPDDAQFWTPYGATECLPVAAIEGRELLTLRERTEQGAGTCVGRPVAPNEVRIIQVSDEAIEHWSDALLVRPGQVGEITVAGPSATDSYFNRDAQTRLAKIRENVASAANSSASETSPASASGPLFRHGESDAGGNSLSRSEDTDRGEGASGQCERIVHRMGDLGYFDAQGRLWFCGRKSQRVVTAAGTLCTEQVEPVFNAHPEVRRTALVGIGAPGPQRPVLCVELRAGVARGAQPRIADELRHLGEGFVHTAQVDTFLFHPRFPVDIRHNAKIGRETLAAWAAKQLRRQA
ncbi:fatty acid CoA ligase family protein [Luteimonas notoginsengisoli]|uniref:Fatty acid CoA ligase family protein n=1 Tax=Luteimonas notoginsengisoli TaxID=1578200 RepID=A0ABV7UV17_9GAMM